MKCKHDQSRRRDYQGVNDVKVQECRDCGKYLVFKVDLDGTVSNVGEYYTIEMAYEATTKEIES